MKLQLENQHLRLRIDEDELRRLFAGEAVPSRTRFAGAFVLTCTLSLRPDALPVLTGDAHAWSIQLPEGPVRELAARLPSRDGLHFTLTGQGGDDALELLFDVDVRDSARRMKASRGH